MKKIFVSQFVRDRSLLLASVAIVSCLSAPVHAQGIPVISVSELAQDVLMVTQLEQQLSTMEQQYTTMTNQYQALTGNRNLGQILNDSSLRNMLPSSWQSVYSAVQSGSLPAISSAAQQIEAAEGMTANTAGQQRYNDTLSANKAISMQGFQQTQSELQNIQSLMQQSNLTQDPAAKADLQNRLQAESAIVQNQQTQMNLVGQLEKIEQNLAAQQAEQQVHNQMAQ
ncbi:type IV secretion system protein VirB5 [Paraburkholderia sp. GAS33]|uniref:type IV secretion system protein n=1 Tax=Paraburkholderia sp. GAS33 TaxID=3035130 RepID=UPI003D1C6019